MQGFIASADYIASNDLFADIPESPAVTDSRVQKRIMSIASIMAGIVLSVMLCRWNSERKLSRWGQQDKMDWRQERAEDKMIRKSQDLHRRLERTMKNIRPISIDTNLLQQRGSASRAGTNVSEGVSRKFNEKGVKERE